jgi:hypothetical protein
MPIVVPSGMAMWLVGHMRTFRAPGAMSDLSPTADFPLVCDCRAQGRGPNTAAVTRSELLHLAEFQLDRRGAAEDRYRHLHA